jgi:hypothetical protein
MAQRRTHSSIDKLPALLKDELVRMLVDNEYPVEFQGDKSGKPKYEDLVAYCAQRSQKVSLSAIGRFGMRMKMIGRMKQAGVMARDAMKDFRDEKASETQKAAAEMITAIGIEFISSNDNPSAKEISDMAKAIKDCAAVAINADKYIREQFSVKAKNADKAITALAEKKQISPEVLKQIREQVYGIVK